MNLRQRLRRGARLLHRLLGAPGWLGAAAALAAVLLFMDARQSEERAQAAQQKLLAAQADAAKRRNTETIPVVLPRPDGLLAAAEDIPATLRELHRLAGLVKLELPQAQYRWVPATDSTPPAYEMTYPLRAAYANLRPFLAMALNTLPALGIRELSMRRTTPEQPDLEIDLRLALLLREEQQ